MNSVSFESKLLPDGHLYCPKGLAEIKNAQFKVIVTFETAQKEAFERDIELAAIHDHSNDFLSQEELNYYLSLEEL